MTHGDFDRVAECAQRMKEIWRAAVPGLALKSCVRSCGQAPMADQKTPSVSTCTYIS
jgi:hypothetical protein